MRVYGELTRGLLLSVGTGAVVPTHELERSDSFKRFRGRRAVIANGIGLDALEAAPTADAS